MEKTDFAAVREATWGLTLAAVVIAFLSGPLIRFVDPTLLMGIAVTLGLTLTAFHSSTAFAAKLPYIVALSLAVIAGLVALALIWIVMAEASESSRANDTRCLAIQQDMLSVRPLRSDGPDLFQALGCRPQGESIYAPGRPTGAP